MSHSRPLSRPPHSGIPLSSVPQDNSPRTALSTGSSPWFNFSHDFQQHSFSSLQSPSGCLPTTISPTQSFDTCDTFAQGSDLWTEPDLSFADTDWNFLSPDNVTPYLGAPRETSVKMSFTDPGFDVASAFASLSDLGSFEYQYQNASSVALSSENSQDGRSQPSPTSLYSASAETSQSSPAVSQVDVVLSRVESSRVEKRKLNTLAARRCRQRRVDQMKNLEEELERIRKERDDLKLKVSKLEGETEVLKTLLSRKSK
ncbi:uncharacterized protein N7483_010824 [Penicillium malachiteum]|uniref:uncharacterized protein n=1 Tax=Penicillium malachiteum TaxID=1324776 RepID=UPI00254964D3|nr:uncharacterized protein N7483_010824 [Penicillium malachiteum]KAJ5713643.1 hypothetical protein N7483_010824 [Penicillium malachiteum]